MILHRLEVSGFRCFTSPVAVSLDPDKINILHGGNGSGKSSLIWALIRAVFDTYRTAGREMRNLRPWGTDLGPSVLVEFEHDGRRFRLKKSFLERAEAHLEEKRQKKYQPLARDRRAEERVRQMLLAEGSRNGLTKPEQWGLARVLWCPQGHLQAAEFEGRVLTEVQHILGGHAFDDYTSALRTAVQKSFDEYWRASGSPKGGKDAPLWSQRQLQISYQIKELTEAKSELVALQSAQQEIQELESKCRTLQACIAGAKHIKEQLQAHVEGYLTLASRCETLHARCEARMAEANRCQEAVERIAELRAKQQSSATRLPELEAAVSRQTATEEEIQQALDKAEEKLNVLNSDPTLPHLDQFIADADAYVAAQRQLTDVQIRIREIEAVQGQIARLENEVSRLGAPDPSALAGLDRLTAKSLELQTKLDSALLHVELRPAATRRVEVVHGEPSGPSRLGPGECLRVSGSPIIELVLEGFGRLKLTGPAQSVAQLKDELDLTIRQIDGFVALFGTSELDELRNRQLKATNCEARLANCRNMLETLLSGEAVMSLRANSEALRQRVRAVESLHPDWRSSPPAVDHLKRQSSEARKQLDDAKSAVSAAWRQWTTQLSAQRAKRMELANERSRLISEAGENERQLSGLRADGLSDHERHERSRKLCVETVGLQEEYKHVCASLDMLGPDPRPNFERAKASLSTDEEALQDANRELHERRGRLKGLQERAPYERYARIEEEISRLTEERDRDLARANALKLLRDTIAECERDITAGFATPVAKRASKLLDRIAGREIGAIELNDGLAPRAFVPGEALGEVSLESLSCGESEQVQLSVRLALAELLTKDSGTKRLVVLDDVVTATDDERLGRVMAILEEMHSHAQFLVLTCHPERYQRLKAARFIDLEMLTAE